MSYFGKVAFEEPRAISTLHAHGTAWHNGFLAPLISLFPWVTPTDS